MIKTMRFTTTTFCLLVLTCFTSAQALTITHTDTWSTSRAVDSGSNSTAARTDSLINSDSFAVSLFDPTLGILNSVRVIYDVIRLTSSASARFVDSDVGQRTAGTQRLSGMGISITLAGINHNRSRSNRSTSCASGIGGINGAACTTSIGASTSTLSSLDTTLTNAIVLSQFTGNGNLQGTARQTGSLFTDETNGDDGFIDRRRGNVNASGTVRVIYDYSEHPPVPLPAAFWLFASAMTGMLYFNRRKNSDN